MTFNFGYAYDNLMLKIYIKRDYSKYFVCFEIATFVCLSSLIQVQHNTGESVHYFIRK